MNRRTIKATFLLLFLMAIGDKLKAQKALTLQDAVTLSLANSKQLKASRAKVLESSAAVKEALDRRLPDATASAAYLRVAKPDVKLQNVKDSSGSNNTTPNVSQAMYGIVNVSLPLFAGHRIRYGIESAKYLEKATILDVDHDRSEVALNAMEAFINLYKAKAATELVKENLAQSKKRVTDLSNLEKNGLLARNDLLKAKLQSSNIELNLLEAESNYKLASVNMNLLLGLPENLELSPDTTSLQERFDVKNIEQYEQIALQTRPDVESYDYRRKALMLNTKSVKAEKYPSLALTGGYIAADIPHFITITNAVNIGVGLQYSISSLWKNDAKLRQAQAKEQELAANQEELNDAIRLQINRAYQNYLLSQKKIEVYKEAIEQAEENYRISNNKYQNSLLTTTELLDADVAQLQARLNYRFAKADKLLAYYRLVIISGAISLSNK